MADLEDSRSRIAAAWLEQRRLVERALHDGVQQDLVALAVGLQLVRERVEQGDADVGAALDELRHDVHGALERVRLLADDVYPSGLETWGLRDTLLRLTPHVRMEGVGRQRRELEAAVVLWCRALLRDAADASIELREEGGVLWLRVGGGRVTEAARDALAAGGGAIAADDEGSVVATFPR